jgi:phosphoglycerol transferase MdoB-like AlkP superfamily enzyme
MAWDEVRARVQRYTHLPDDAYLAPGSIQHRPAAVAARPRPLNLVIVLEESLGAGHVGHLGGLPLTPNLDRLRGDGMWFSQLYATGTRTARGMEAVVAGFPPSPALSVLKLPGAQGGFWTLAAALKQQGYDTEFIYGGAANFDNMRAFYLANGFDRVIEERDFSAPDFVASWGVSDEDLLVRANQEFRVPRARPFFALVLSSSNHEPFEIPAGRIEPYDQPLYSRANAIKYADHAVGRFFEMARREAYYADTLFVVAADHDARVFGATLVPVERFRIPALIIGPGVPAGPYQRVASQVDLAPTLLRLLGVDAPTPTMGRDLLALPADDPGRALMQYDNNHGFRVGDRMVVHQPHLPAQTFRVVGERLEPIADDPELTRDALAHALWPGEVYRGKLYRVEE